MKMRDSILTLAAFDLLNPAQVFGDQTVIYERAVPVGKVEEYPANTRLAGRLALALAAVVANGQNAAVNLPNRAVQVPDEPVSLWLLSGGDTSHPVYQAGQVPGSPPATYGVVTWTDLGGIKVTGSVQVYNGSVANGQFSIVHFPARGVLTLRGIKKETGTVMDYSVIDVRRWNSNPHDSGFTPTRLQQEGILGQDRYLQLALSGIDLANHTVYGSRSRFEMDILTQDLETYAQMVTLEVGQLVTPEAVLTLVDRQLARV